MPRLEQVKCYPDTGIVAEMVLRRFLTQREITAGNRTLEKTEWFGEAYRAACKAGHLNDLPPKADTVLEDVAREAMLWYFAAKRPKPEKLLPMGPNELLNLLVQTTLYAWKIGVFYPSFLQNWYSEQWKKEHSIKDCLIPYRLYRKNVERMTEKEAMKYLPGVLRYACLWNNPPVTFIWKEAGVKHPGSLMEWLEELPKLKDWPKKPSFPFIFMY